MATTVTIERHPVGPLQANAYLLVQAARAVIVDPGEEPEVLLAALARHHAVLEGVCLTHADFDHVGGLAGLLEATAVAVYLHPEERPLLLAARAQAAVWGIAVRQPDGATRPLADGQQLRLAGIEIRCLFTPGHTPGHMSFHLPQQRAVFTGDALFRGSIGRTDRPFGDAKRLLASIRTRLLVLPPDTHVLPGHGPETTIARELRTNPFLAAG